MTVIVTGGAGFLGRHLVDSLLAQGRKVLVLDSLWTGTSKVSLDYKDNQNFSFIKCSVKEPLPAVDSVEEIYHLACPASPDHFEVSPVEILETCFLGTKNVLDLAVKTNAKVLITSTSEIYGDPKVVPQAESYWGNVNSFGPRSCYDEGKRVTEALAFAYQLKHKLEVRIARIFNAYGPYMKYDDGRAVPNFIAAAMEGKPIRIYGDGSATRCFQFATDCVGGLMALMDSDYNRPVNIGSDRETSVRDIANMTAKVVATKMGHDNLVPIHYLPARQDDPNRRKPDITVARKVLGWEPKVPLEQGLTTTVDWFLERMGNNEIRGQDSGDGESPITKGAAGRKRDSVSPDRSVSIHI